MNQCMYKSRFYKVDLKKNVFYSAEGKNIGFYERSPKTGMRYENRKKIAFKKFISEKRSIHLYLLDGSHPSVANSAFKRFWVGEKKACETLFERD